MHYDGLALGIVATGLAIYMVKGTWSHDPAKKKWVHEDGDVPMSRLSGVLFAGIIMVLAMIGFTDAWEIHRFDSYYIPAMGVLMLLQVLAYAFGPKS